MAYYSRLTGGRPGLHSFLCQNIVVFRLKSWVDKGVISSKNDLIIPSAATLPRYKSFFFRRKKRTWSYLQVLIAGALYESQQIPFIPIKCSYWMSELSVYRKPVFAQLFMWHKLMPCRPWQPRHTFFLLTKPAILSTWSVFSNNGWMCNICRIIGKIILNSQIIDAPPCQNLSIRPMALPEYLLWTSNL